MLNKFLNWLRTLGEPTGYMLLRVDGTRHNGIRYDLIEPDALVIEEDGRYFVRTGRRDDVWLVYQEDHKTEHYRSEY